MPSEVAQNLSVLELIQALNEKLGLERTRTLEICLPPTLSSIAALKPEVSGHWPIYLNERGGII